jgi:hypothetical protein
MPFATKSEMEATVAAWLARPDLAPNVPDFIRLAEAELERKLECTFQHTALSGTLSGTGVLTLPADALYLRRLSIDSLPPRDIEWVSPDQLNNLQFSRNGDLPFAGYRSGDTIKYVPTSDGSAAYTGEYVKAVTKLGTVGAAADTDYLTNLFDALLYGALKHSAPFLKADARVVTWGGFFEDTLDSIRRFESRKRFAGQPLRMRPASYA